MRKFLLVLGLILLTCTSVFAAKIPEEVKSYIENSIPGTDIRFDGVIITPDNTVYLPLFPSLFSDIKSLKIKSTYPENMELSQKPDIVIFNNDFVLLKVLSDGEGRKTVLYLQNPPLQVRTGLLPQDMLVPSGLILPENIKGITGNLKIDTKSEDVIKQTSKESFEEFLAEEDVVQNQTLIPQLKGKILFVTTNYSKNIQVLEPAKNMPLYSLAQKSIPIDIEAVDNGKFLLVTSYERPFLDIISVPDSRFIKQIDLGSFPDKILVDYTANKAYITSPTASTIFVVDLKTMSLIQKIKINGYCENLLLSGDKIFYTDKLKGDIWSIEIDKGYTLKNIGKFPNVSALAFADNNLYIASRTKSRVAVVDYSTLGLISEFTTVNKPVKMTIYKNILHILGAQNNVVQRINIANGKPLEPIELNTDGFTTGYNPILGTDLAVYVDVKKNLYSIVNLSTGKLLKTYSTTVPIKEVVVTDKVELFK